MENWHRMRMYHVVSYSLQAIFLIALLWLCVVHVQIYQPRDPIWRRSLMAALLCLIVFAMIYTFRRFPWMRCAYGDCELRKTVKPGFSEYLLALTALVMLGLTFIYIVSLFKNFSEVFDRREILGVIPCIFFSFFGFFPAIRWGAQWDEEGLHVGKGPLRSFYHWGSISKVTFIRYDDFSDKILSFKLFFVDGNYKLFKAVRGPRKTPAFVKSFYNECLRRRIPVDYEHDKYFDKNFSLDEVFEKRAE